ncbi:GNAT family N-acetyltransferase [Halomicrobium mukohataei]|uniref:GNAT family N-acetyltransferase n=1 Tax=Halomicrobium mukohataei TaxID=57705 RepID=A0A847UGR7_9EURY|nr:GNAT family N-acetyltransferase [Halomicrobium mukohataei]NLV11447.1 GNAT family N-acetyltransferase [Halomicrobium mukohataei]
MSVTELTTDEQWDAAVPILRQLWCHEDEAFVREFRDEADYRLFGLYDDDRLVAVAGVSLQRVLHHRRHVWIHDLVVDDELRGQGYGAELLDWIEDWGEDEGCEYVALACPRDNDDGLAFYDSEGLEQWGYVVETELDGDGN